MNLPSVLGRQKLCFFVWRGLCSAPGYGVFRCGVAPLGRRLLFLWGVDGGVRQCYILSGFSGVGVWSGCGVVSGWLLGT